MPTRKTIPKNPLASVVRISVPFGRGVAIHSFEVMVQHCKRSNGGKISKMFFDLRPMVPNDLQASFVERRGQSWFYLYHGEEAQARKIFLEVIEEGLDPHEPIPRELADLAF